MGDNPNEQTPSGIPDISELLQRNSQLGQQFDPWASLTGGGSPGFIGSSPSNTQPDHQGGHQLQQQQQLQQIQQQQQQQIQQPGGLKRRLLGALGMMSDAAMKYSTGMTPAEQQQIQEHTAQLHTQTEQLKQYGPLEHQARLDALTAQPRFDPDTQQFLGQMSNDKWADYLKQRLINKGKADVADTKTTGQQNLAKQYASQMAAGDQAGATETLKQINGLTTATSKPSPQNEISLRVKAQQGDPEALAVIQKLQSDRQALATTRSQMRLYQMQKFYDPETQQLRFGTGFDVLAAQKEGKQIVPAGALNANEIKSFQQLTSEAVPAIAGVRKNIGTFDNAGDRAVFARVLKSAGSPRYGEEAGWMGNIINQSLKSGLSPEGQGAAISLLRLAETMGRLRSTLGGPSTDIQMGLALQLLPGASTPNSKYAGEQLNQLEQMVKQAVNIPVFGNKKQGSSTGGGAKKDPLGIF